MFFVEIKWRDVCLEMNVIGVHAVSVAFTP